MALPALLAGLIPDFIKGAVDMIDRKFPSEAEKEKAKRDLEEKMEGRLQDAWDTEQKQLTERHKNDMMSDSWLSKNIRPLTLVYLNILFTIAFFTTTPPEVLQILQSLLMVVFTFYFGSRGLEKVLGMLTKNK